MDQILTGEMVKALGEGDMKRFAAYVLIFFVIWLEVRGLKKQFKLLNETIANSFAAGEKRFETIEKDVHEIREDLDGFKQKIPIGGFA